MDRESLKDLEHLNQLRLTDEQADEVMAFFAAQALEQQRLAAIDTESVERMVHVNPLVNVLREDVAAQPFTREELQEGAPETMDGYWQVPRLVG